MPIRGMRPAGEKWGFTPIFCAVFVVCLLNVSDIGTEFGTTVFGVHYYSDTYRNSVSREPIVFILCVFYGIYYQYAVAANAGFTVLVVTDKKRNRFQLMKPDIVLKSDYSQIIEYLRCHSSGRTVGVTTVRYWA